MMTWGSLVVVLLGVAGILYWAWRSRELFCLSVRDGRVLIVRGRIPGRYLSDVREIVRRDRVVRGTIRAVLASKRARLVCSGAIDERTAQRLRNTFLLLPMATLRQAPPLARPTIGQVLGIAWLAWLVAR